MTIKLNPNLFFVFDLDDSLFQEIEFLKSAYRHIARQIAADSHQDIFENMWLRYQQKENVFAWLLDQYQTAVPQLSLPWLLQEYREHIPVLELASETAALLSELKFHNIPMGLITDGRSVTQRNKLKALGIIDYFDDIIISEEFGSEKPDEKNYRYFENKYPERDFYFVGDNTSKDFITPLKLGWKTICLKDSGQNIHPQQLGKEPAPHFIISSFKEVEFLKT